MDFFLKVGQNFIDRMSTSALFGCGGAYLTYLGTDAAIEAIPSVHKNQLAMITSAAIGLAIALTFESTNTHAIIVWSVSTGLTYFTLKMGAGLIQSATALTTAVLAGVTTTSIVASLNFFSEAFALINQKAEPDSIKRQPVSMLN